MRTCQFVSVVVFISFVLVTLPTSVFATDGDPQWAKTAVIAPGSSAFEGVSVDSSGSVYAAGYMATTSQYTLDGGLTISGYNTTNNPLIVKYNSTGTALWAKTTSVSSNQAKFYKVAVDASGFIYVVGSVTGSGEFDFGNGVTVSGVSTSTNLLIVKYNENGEAVWARTTVVAPSSSTYRSVSVDSEGNIIVVGTISGTGTYNVGNDVSVAGKYSGTNIILVKYTTGGIAQWAISLDAGAHNSELYDVTLDDDNNIYVCGKFYGTGLFDFGSSITISGVINGYNPFITKYDAEGTAQWVKSVENGTSSAQHNSVEIDRDGNIYVVGNGNNASEYDYGNGVTVSGSSSSGNGHIVKYNADGVAQWARSTYSGSVSSFLRISIANPDDIYVVGKILGLSEYNFGNGITVSGTFGASNNAVLVKYNAQGEAQLARSSVTGGTLSAFNDAAIDSAGRLSIAGLVGGAIVGFGNDVSVDAGNATSNIFIIQYAGVVPITPSPTPTPTTSLTLTAAANSSTVFYQISPEAYYITGGVVTPINDSYTGKQQIAVTIEPKNFNFNAYLSASLQSDAGKFISSNIPGASTNATLSAPSNTILAGGAVLGVRAGNYLYWQVGGIQEIWYKTYPPFGSNLPPARIIPSLQAKESRIYLSYDENDLIPPGLPSYRFLPESLRIAQSMDGYSWQVIPSVLLDTQKNTVSATDYVGGYYMIVGR